MESASDSAKARSKERTVYCEDALDWLRTRGQLEGCSLITSLPDVSEVPAGGLERWKVWFLHAARLVLESCPPEGVTIFYQTDVKVEGTWVDKGFLCQKAAECTGSALLWHKIVCRSPAGSVTFGRPAYSHMLCFSKGQRADPARSTPDVLPDRGAVTWARGMGLLACRSACRYVLEHTPTRTVVDPFCGQGLVLAVANEMGLDAVGVELSRKRARQARLQQLI